MIATEKNWGWGGGGAESSCLKIEEYTSSSKAKVKMGLFCKFLSDQIQTGLIFTITYIPGHNTHAIFIFDSAGACVCVCVRLAIFRVIRCLQKIQKLRFNVSVRVS